AALDIVDAEAVKDAGDLDLVLEGEVDAVGLGAVAKRGVEQVETFSHDGNSGQATAGGHASVSRSGCWWLITRCFQSSCRGSDPGARIGRPGIPSTKGSLSTGFTWMTGAATAGSSKAPMASSTPRSYS